jgi:hypothetical protein
MLLSLVMWPFKPYDLLRIAVAECFNALANYLQTFAGEAATTENILDVRTALETARMTLGTVVAAVILVAIASKPLIDIIIVVTVFFGVALIGFNYGYSVVFLSIFILLITDRIYKH